MTWQNAVSELLASLIGLDVASVGPGVIEGAVRQRSALAGVDTPEAYVTRLGESAAERSAFIEEVVVPESWFFRDGQPFHRLQAYVSGLRIRKEVNRAPLRILSLPCAGGEEAYSIAIALREIGLTARQVHIDALDISSRALARARRGVFGPHAFRGPEFCDTSAYFLPHPGGLELTADMRAGVHFREGNLLDADLLADRPAYDVVFCRNLLIYLTSAARQHAIDALHRLLAEDGMLFVGHAEMLSILEPRFTPDGDRASFAYRRVASVAPPSPPPAPATAGRPVAAAVDHQPPDPPAPIEEALPASLLDRAAELVNQQEHDEAVRLCERALHLLGPAPRTFLMLGMIELARGDTERAEANLLKAVYLDGNEDEALLALALISERRGEQEAAARFQRRAERARLTKGRR